MSRSQLVGFFDAFAGIGGIRMGFERAGFKCAGSCEVDSFRREIYESNFRTKGEFRHSDIKTLRASALPDFDVLTGGFPCQSFSQSGDRMGMEDPRGRLFFSLARILRISKPKAFLFENVKGLTLMRREFADIVQHCLSAGYRVKWAILNSQDFGVPQSRPRVFMVGFKSANAFTFPRARNGFKVIRDIMEPRVKPRYYLKTKNVKSAKFVLPNGWQVRHKRIINIGNHFPSNFQTGDIHSPFGLCRCLVPSNESVINAPLVLTRWRRDSLPTVRHLTPRECARLQGFPDGFRIYPNDRLSYRYLGDSVTVNVIEDIANEMKKCLTR